MIAEGPTGPEARRWPVHHRSGSCTELHGADLGSRRALWVLEPETPGIVLGSTQDASLVDAAAAAAAGVEIARRRSGGGLVWLDSAAVWIDVTLARSDPLWEDDVSRAALWLGRAWIGALAASGMEGLEVVVERPATGASVVCFGSVFPGEVVDARGRKVVGISQRRGREGARFQCVAYSHWDPEPMARCLVDPGPARGLDGGTVGTVPVGGPPLALALSGILERTHKDGGAEWGEMVARGGEWG